MEELKRSKNGKYVCDCCGYNTLDEGIRGSYEICPVCLWEDDGFIDEEGYYDTGANHECLSVAQENYKSFGACERRVVKYVRKPNDDEVYVGVLMGYKRDY